MQDGKVIFQTEQGRSLIGVMRDAKCFLSLMSLLSIFLFLFVFYSPTAQAVKQAIEDEFGAQLSIKTATDEMQLSNTVAKIKEDIVNFKSKIKYRSDQEISFWEVLLNYFGLSSLLPEEMDGIAELSDEIVQLNEKVVGNFSKIEDDLKAEGLPAEILLRHAQTVEDYNVQYGALKNNLRELQSAKSLIDQQDAANELDSYLQEKQFKRNHQPLDPKNLPFTFPSEKARAPLEGQQELDEMLGRVNAPGDIVETVLNSLVTNAYAQTGVAPRAEDLLETPDVQMTQEIRDLAAQLNHDAIQIYQWVHNNIRFIASYGSIQGSHLTLINRQGNAFDTASLLVALLRASNISARYAYGTVDIAADKLMNWVGGAATIEAAQEILGQGGIPNVARIVAGQIASIKMEHIWVEAWVDFEPSRGAINRHGDAWVPMDGSFKQYAYTDGSNVLTDMPFDYDGLYGQVSQTAYLDPTLGSVGGLKERQDVITNYLKNYQQQLESYFSTNAPNKTIGEIFGEQLTNVIAPTVLSAGLPYKVIVQADAFSVLPVHMRHMITLNAYQSFGGGYSGLSGTAIGQPSFSYKVSLPEINSKRFAISYVPATDADQNALQRFYASGAGQLPLYLLNVKPVISIAGETVFTGSSVRMGQAQQLEIVLGLGGRAEREIFEITAGDEIVVGVNGSGINSTVVNAASQTSSNSTASENLHQVALSYWMLCDYFNKAIAKALNVVSYRQVSVGIFSSPLSVNYFFGIPRSGNYQSRVMDVPHSVLSVGASTQDKLRAFMFQAGMQGSYFEGATFDLLFGNAKGSGVSAVQLLMDANFENQSLYELTPDNMNDVLPLLSIDNDTRRDIVAAVNADKAVIISQGDIRRGDWTGIGYIILDKKTGAGAYLISGGLNGGANVECESSLVPLVVAIVFAILLALLAVYIAGLLAAAAVGAAASAGGALAMRVLIASFVALFASNAAIANPLDEPCTCGEHYAACMEAGLGGSVGNDSACYACFQRCQGQGGQWPGSITIIVTGGIGVTVSCNY